MCVCVCGGMRRECAIVCAHVRVQVSVCVSVDVCDGECMSGCGVNVCE